MNIYHTKSTNDFESSTTQPNLNLIYLDLLGSSYTETDIRLYFLIQFQIDIFKPENQFVRNKKRIGQEEFKKSLIDRFGSKCILTGSSKFEACHIVPYANSNNMCIDNGLLLNSQHHLMFDEYIWSINPKTLNIEINYSKVDEDDIFIQLIRDKNLNILDKYPQTIRYLSKHYSIFLSDN
jgi:hypothetical protein